MANDGDRRTPPDSIPALAIRVDEAEQKVERSADWSFEAYQMSKVCLAEIRELRKEHKRELDGLRDEFESFKKRTYDIPNLASAIAIGVSLLTAIYVAVMSSPVH